MAEGQKDAAALDAAAVQKLIADAMKPVTDSLQLITQNQKVIADTIAADAATKAEAEKAQATEAGKGKDAGTKDTAGKPLTAEEVNKLIGDSLSSVLKARDQEAQSNAARDKFVAEKLKGVPTAYQSKLGKDPAKWAAEEQAIREELKADLASMGATVKNVSGGASGGSADAAAPKTAASYAQSLTPGQGAFAAGLLASAGGVLSN